MFLSKTHTETETVRLVLVVFYVFKKALFELKGNRLHFSLDILRQPSNWIYNKRKLYM